MAKLITSQHHLDDAIVEAKVAASDFAVFVSPEFEVDGEIFQVVLDGHHSLAAAIEAGATPEINVMDATSHDAVAILDNGDIEGFLAAVHMGDGDYIDAITRQYVW